jgi:hypothetical protein
MNNEDGFIQSIMELHRSNKVNKKNALLDKIKTEQNSSNLRLILFSFNLTKRSIKMSLLKKVSKPSKVV